MVMSRAGIPANGQCALCDGEAYTRGTADGIGDVYLCDRCGRYGIQRRAINGVTGEQRYLLSA